MNSETKTCQNCKNQFVIEPDDFAFYEKIKVPPPTWCPQCRLQRRLVFRNERVLYKCTCSLCKKNIIGVYPEGVKFPVYCSNCWWSDKWNPTAYAQDYDFNKPFFEQFKALQNKVPRQHTNNTDSSRLINSEYTNCAGDQKNCYLVFGAMNDEDSLYSHYLNYSKDCVDNLYSIKNEGCYECIDIENSSNLLYCQSCLACRDSAFLFDCRNCNDCLGCVGLRNKRYYIFNKPYGKEEYLKEKEKYNLSSRIDREKFRKIFLETLYYKSPRKYYHGQMNKDFSGDYISNSERTRSAFYTKNARNSKYLFWSVNVLDVYDYFAWGDMELCYECVSGGYGMYDCKFTHTAWTELRGVEYSSLCFSSSNLFGCIGLRKKQFCILNKQYKEDEYVDLRNRIVTEMDSRPYHDKRGLEYRYGENFPVELSPFAYIDTVAQEHFPLSPEDIKINGYPWRDMETKNYSTTKKASELPDVIAGVNSTILNEIIECEHKGQCGELCTTAFKIVSQELQFYQKKNIPLPLLCHNCRHAQRVKQRNPLKLWHRVCQCSGGTVPHFHGASSCPNEFETAYAPDRPEIVYCEQCYNAEVA